MYGGVGAADFHEFHSFSWNSLNSPKFHRISWFYLNFMKFMKNAEITAKKAHFLARPRKHQWFLRNSIGLGGQLSARNANFHANHDFCWKWWKIMKIIIIPRKSWSFMILQWFCTFGPRGTPKYLWNSLGNIEVSVPRGEKAKSTPRNSKKRLIPPKMVKFHENTNNFMKFMIFHGLGGKTDVSINFLTPKSFHLSENRQNRS